MTNGLIGIYYYLKWIGHLIYIFVLEINNIY